MVTISPSSENIKGKTVIVVSHVDFPGSAHALVRYLKENEAKCIYFIQHDFFSRKSRKSTLDRIDLKGTETLKQSLDVVKLPHIFVHFWEQVVCAYFILRYISHADIAVGLGAINCFGIILLRALLGVNRLIFYTIDFVPVRFKNRLLNDFYHWLDRFALAHSDETWNVSPMISEGREQLFGLKTRDFPHQKVVPIGLWPEDILKQTKLKSPWSIIFVGSIIEKQGVQYAIEAMAQLRAEMPLLNLTIVGDGNYKTTLEELVDKLNMTKTIRFTGPIYDSKQVTELISKSQLGIALYDKKTDQFTKFADATKLKTYLGSGTPILTTNVPFNAAELAAERVAFITECDTLSVTNALRAFFSPAALKDDISLRCLSFASRFDWNKIYNAAFQC